MAGKILDEVRIGGHFIKHPELSRMIALVREAREQVLGAKMAQLKARFPEIDDAVLKSLTDEQVIDGALVRELRWHHQMLDQINKE